MAGILTPVAGQVSPTVEADAALGRGAARKHAVHGHPDQPRHPQREPYSGRRLWRQGERGNRMLEKYIDALLALRSSAPAPLEPQNANKPDNR